MKNWTMVLGLAACVTLLAGCGKDDEITGTTPAANRFTESEPNETTPNDLGALGADALTVTGATSNSRDIDRFAVQIGSGTNLHASLEWQGGSDLDLGMLDPQGIVLAYERDGPNRERCTLAGLPAGRYILEVTSTTATGTPYTLTVASR